MIRQAHEWVEIFERETQRTFTDIAARFFGDLDEFREQPFPQSNVDNLANVLKACAIMRAAGRIV
jgi:hypothetical protein